MQISAIGRIESPFEEKFGAPRQPLLVPEATGTIRLNAPWDAEEAIRGLEAFSHIWVIYGFHLNPETGTKTTARPPRLGGNERVGVFASRSPFRPNQLGLSVVQLIEAKPGELRVGGLDMVDGSPVYDIKPYLPWVEAIPEAASGFADTKPESDWKVDFEAKIPSDFPPNLIESALSQDPRPAYHENQPNRIYGMKLAGYAVRWRVDEAERVAKVLEISPTK